MSDRDGKKRLVAEARATCAAMEESSRKLLAWSNRYAEDAAMVILPADEVRAMAHALAHQGGRLDMAVSMAHTRSARRKK